MASYTIEQLDVQQDIGRRAYQEDYFYADSINDRFFIALVCDGHGGAKAARFLSLAFRESAQIMFKTSLNILDIPLVLTRFVDLLGPRFEMLYPGASDGTTLCGVVVDLYEGVATTFNLGDSQAIVYNKRSPLSIISVTKPDTTDDPEERMRLARLGFPCQRDSDGTWRLYELNMTRAFGDYGQNKLNTALNDTRGRTPRVETIDLKVARTGVLVASDGLFDVIEATQANLNIFQKNNAKDLIDLANAGPKGDNITVIKFEIKRLSDKAKRNTL